MQETILDRIVRDKAVWLAARQQQQPLASFQNDIVPATRSFYDALKGARTAFILECKKASPSKGVIREDFDPAVIAGVYRHYASAISVLTDEQYFQGNFDFLAIVSAAVSQPVLCKDFIISPYQIHLARYYQADAILLMLSVLDDEQYRQLATVAHSLNMGVLTEVINDEELKRATSLGAKVVGINNRDLRDLSIDLDRTRRLAPAVAHNVTVISESGINSHAQVRELSHFANGFLIGSALMSEDNLAAAVRRVMLGENKVCGLTRPQDARSALECGAIYGGLIFAAGSPRQIDAVQAQQVIAAAALQYVGVFRNDSVGDIVTIARHLNLHAVQLHGDENRDFISQLRAALPENVQIWKAFSISTRLPARDWPHVDRYVFDQGNGGSGKAFDWSLLKGEKLDNVLLAGGLSADNCVVAAQQGCAGLDFNSGVESAPGIKDAAKMASVFQTLKAW
ncbi:bifunctional indole-3-glycerol-phosphate synthase TrpC/phosphoribosylanthranilate isomerase TrpF [Erwinia pyrifoliae]|uniref:bifunctional indole-3-glycerol-phosphate synthase TrpC/phosphoribosylanthranilate isomerase TrpF n=1 Tax=Erwinia pyrifoliae TaxID=79967 RepID=UPI0001960C2C|nr:bifunctional indole-3-glycerol-phosphate synthase TrpC/phosphoribosylanthranilate isomerase TrpF [Erwinia pyrifoliae]AUX72839.1 bifunctional indole-3-glycerol-phosphate synthase TrpC/phosphoribosylanthranilate isomerase TrpF [Erwinia pyrifoliae]MCA8876895.1 bifunctional indole-3-glycerol-phosphate synthase TrpC/phosphoribosylanthranilate isomerase TrpF [Erwinia pyrifoliae]UXK10781.1 bifunctional indole-3-glycerol-phosphate synthase TrpC/phosphoribosylanthranilate isomerase TrpF [Erwinia pyrif